MKTIRQQIEYIPKGDIEGFPIEVVNLMLKRQKEQTGKEDVSVFEERKTKTKAGGAFDWDLTEDGHSFWFKVIDRRMFDVFFERYPKDQVQQPDRKYPRTMLVWDDGVDHKMETKIVADFYVDGRKYFVNVAFHVWQNAEDLPEKTKVTLSEALQIVAEKLGKSVDKIEIEKFTQDELQLLWAGKKATCDKDCHCHSECPVADEYIKNKLY